MKDSSKAFLAGQGSGRGSRRGGAVASVLALAALALLVLASAAGAERSVLSQFDAPDVFPVLVGTRGTDFESPAIADSGGAWPEAGDLYLGGRHCDLGTSCTQLIGSFVEQLSPSGALKRLWGADIVKSGPGQADETQAVRVSATAGSFTLGFRRSAAAGNGELGAGSTTVSFVTTASGAFAAGQAIEGPGIPAGTTIAAVGNPNLQGNREITLSQPAAFAKLNAPLLATEPGPAGVTGPLAFDAGAQQVADALDALPSVSAGGGSVTVTGGPGDAAGSAPYVVTFDGGPLHGTDEPLLLAEASGLSGSAGVYTINPGGTGFEICEPANGDVCKGPQDIGDNGSLDALSLAQGAERPGTMGNASPKIAIDQSNGDLYAATALRRVNAYSPSGEFLRAFGYDVVRQGPDDSANQEVQQLTVSPSATGSYTLSLFIGGQGIETTAPIGVAAPAAEVEAAIEALPFFAINRGSVAVTRSGSGTGGDPYVYTIAFDGRFAGDVWEQFEASPSAAGSVVTTQDGGGLETCVAGRDACKLGQLAFGAYFGLVGALVNSGGETLFLEIAPPAAPNHGDVLVDGANRVDEFSGAGDFVRAFGWDVVTSGPDDSGTGFEVCKGGTADVCKAGTSGGGLGQFDDTPTSIAEGGDGSIYAVDSGNRRVQKFTPAGGLDLTPSLVGADESQQLTVNAAAGQFRVGVLEPKGAAGTADQVPGSNVLTKVNTASGTFLVGQWIKAADAPGPSFGFPEGTTIASVNGSTITTSNPIPESTQAGTHAFTATLPRFSPGLPHNASATDPGTPGVIDSVQEAVNGLLPLAVGGGSSVHVAGPDGGPYTIAFDGGNAPGFDFPPLITAQGTTPLSGGSGPGANQATVTTLSDGGPNGRLEADAPSSVGVLPNGDPVVAKRYPELASICPAGSGLERSIAETRIQEFSPDGHTMVDTSPPCNIDPGFYLEGKGLKAVSASIGSVDPSSGEIYSRDKIIGEVGPPAEFPPLDPVSGLTATSATISGEIDPNGPGTIPHPGPALTRFAVEYRKAGDADWTRFVSGIPVGSGNDPVPFGVGVGGLLPRTEYEVRVVAIKPFGFAPVIQTTPPFTTLAGKPRIASPHFDNLSASSVDLHALVNPSGAETTYRFEYGTTTAYGQSTPPVSVGEGSTPVAVEGHIAGLDPVVYHFRVVATNSEGTVAGDDQTFNFYPEPCPNATVRQQTGSTLLPDCRAYELVSPGAMGTVQLFAQGSSAAHATNPPRFAYAAQAGVLPGPWNPQNGTSGSDQYVATRAAGGWQSHYVGVEADFGRTPAQGALAADLALDRFLQYGPNSAKTGFSSAPYLFDAQGSMLGRLPTNLGQIPGGDPAETNSNFDSGPFINAMLLSGDGRHAFYSSAKVALAPGGLTTGAGSVYDNEIDTGAVQVVSKTESGADIPPMPAPGDANAGHSLLPAGASTDGSRVLVAAPSAAATCGDARGCLSSAVLYMRVDGTHSFDVSGGKAVSFQGMSRDGSKVYFTTAEHMTGDDTDTGTDLYMWSEAGDTLTRLSAAADPVGDTDACLASWIAACGVQVVSGGATTDNATAPAGAAAYFYSPEQLVGSDGFPGRRNLYAYHDGQVHFVAALDADKPTTRIQVSADGRFAAFVTRSRLTGYDNAGHAEMYRYDAQAEELVCVSCDPQGIPPSHDVTASQNGSFMTDDGRVFFGSLDPLVPLDADGLPDVYEFVNGRAQLISTGVAASGDPNAGLVGVSADGTDVYFSTLETLVSQDKNGPFRKFYDARTNGGFPVAAQIQPCAAAEECHGPGNAAPAAPSLGSTADLGDSGRAPAPPRPCGKGKVRKHGRCVPRHRHQKHRHHARANHGGKK